AQPLRPVLPDHLVVAADAAGGDDHRRGAQAEIADDLARGTLAAFDVVSFEHRANDALDCAVRHHECVDAVAKPERQPAVYLRFSCAAFERFYDAGAGAPGDVK